MFGEPMTINFAEPNSSSARLETPLVKDQQSLNLLDSITEQIEENDLFLRFFKTAPG